MWKGCLGSNLVIMCGCEELTTHLFFECLVFSGVWSGICQGLGVSFALQMEGHLHLE